MQAEIVVIEDVDWEFSTTADSKNVKDNEMNVLLEETIPLNARNLWALLFSTGFQTRFHEKVNDRDFQIGTWEYNGKEFLILFNSLEVKRRLTDEIFKFIS